MITNYEMLLEVHENVLQKLPSPLTITVFTWATD